MRIFPRSTIDGGRFKNLNLKGNFRIQLHIYDSFPHHSYTANFYYNKYKYSNVTKQQLKLYNFEEKIQILHHKIVILTKHHHHIRKQENNYHIQNHYRHQF